MSTSMLRRLLRRGLSGVMSRKRAHHLGQRWGGWVPGLLIRQVFKAVAVKEAQITTPLLDVEYLVYYAEPQAGSHYNLWDSVFAPLNGRYISIVRFAEPWWGLNHVDAVYPVSTLAQSEALFRRLPNLKAVFYPANNGLNLQGVRHTPLTHVFLGHGDSNKASSANKAFRLYDEIWIAGPAHRERFDPLPGNYSALDFRIIGQPWMQKWLKERANDVPNARHGWGYFPTWAGYYKDTNYSSLHLAGTIADVVEKVIGSGEKGYFKLHPWTPLSAQKAAASQVRSPDSIAIAPAASALRDVLERPLRFVVCDISAALTECLYINVPIFLFKPPASAVLQPAFKTQNAFCYLFSTLQDLEVLLQRVIVEGHDDLAPVRRAAMAHLVDIEKTHKGQFYLELDRLSQSMPQHPAAE